MEKFVMMNTSELADQYVRWFLIIRRLKLFIKNSHMQSRLN